MIFRVILFTIILFQTTAVYSSWTNVFNKAMTGIHWSLVMIPSFGLASAQFVSAYSLKYFLNAAPEIDSFVKDELKKHNCSENLINNLHVKIGHAFEARYIFGGKHIIAIPESFKHMQAWTTNQKMEISGSIRHEAAHIEHRDTLRISAFTLLSPLLSHYIVKGLTYPAVFVLQPYTPSVVQSMTKIPSAFLKLSVIYLLIIFFAKYREYKADKAAAQNIKNPEILRCLAKMFLKSYEFGVLHAQERRAWRRFIYDELLCDNRVHPNGLFRSKIFENAAQELEKSNKN